jgi:hypothetical protein
MSNLDPTPKKLFYSYSHDDEPFLVQLEKHLAFLKRLGLLSGWYDRQIRPGREWPAEIDHNLETAHIVVLLVSAHFLASDYCYQIEMQRALQRQAAGECCVVPVLLKPADWKGAPFAHLQALPGNGCPVTSWANPEEAWLDVARGIRALCEPVAAQPIIGCAAGGTAADFASKFYLYASEPKIDMIFSQLPRQVKEELCRELRLGFDECNGSSRFAKLAAVDRYLRTRVGVGSCDAPQAYFAGSLPMKSTILEEKYVYFGGTSGNQAVALVGSPRNLLGQGKEQPGGRSRGFSAYLNPMILRSFATHANGEIEPRTANEATEQEFGYYVRWINQQLAAPAQGLEFLAKRLCTSSDALLGTPIYVALTD